MTPADFKRIALSLDGAEEGSHMGAVDFRVGGRIFATLASQAKGYGNLILTPEQQAAFIEELPEVFVPVAGGMGAHGRNPRCACSGEREVQNAGAKNGWAFIKSRNAVVGSSEIQRKRRFQTV
jgi:hypothetical protein